MRDRKRAAMLALLALLAALVLVAAGCGGSDEATSDETTVETTVDTDTTEDTTEETTEETTGDETTEPDLSGIANEDCLEFASIGAKFSEALSATGSSADLETTSQLFQELSDNAPDEIKDDILVLAGAWEEIAAALGDVDLSSGEAPSAETLAKLQELGETFNSAEIQEASANLGTWAEENCGVSG